MKVLDLFSGIGGFSLGLEKVGFKTVAFCEIDPFCQNVLRKHWPNIPIYKDINEINYEKLKNDGIKDVDIITGGFPCQDLSIAGKKKGINENTRSGLWWGMRRIISEIRPKFAIMENVPNFLSGEWGAWFGDFLASLAEIGYDAEWHCISAAEVGKPHLRKRVWIIAYSDGERFNPILEKINLSESHGEQATNRPLDIHFDNFKRSYPEIPEYLRMDDGIPIGLDEVRARVNACGNSIVPEIAYLIGKQISCQMPD